MKTEQKLTVFYDGLCQLCSREIDHYRKQDGASNIDFIDICQPGFKAEDQGVDPFEVHKVMHVRRPDGTLATRVEAFVEIWERLPKYRRFAKWARLRGVNQCLEVGYTAFAFVRPYLPRKKPTLDCSSSPYCETKKV